MNRNRTRLSLAAAALALALAVSACGGGNNSSSSSSAPSSSSPSSSESSSSSSQPTPELDGAALLDDIYKDMELMGVMDVDETVMADLLGIPEEYYDSFYARYSLARFNIGEVFLVKPSDKEGAAQFVKDKLEEYRKSRETTFQNYNVGGDYEKARDARLYERGGYVVLLILEDTAPAEKLIEERIPE